MARRPPHLALNPPYFLVFCCFCLVFFWFFFPLFLIQKKTLFPPNKAFLFILECLPLFLLSLLLPPSFSLSLSLSLSCFSFFLPPCFSLGSLFLFFVFRYSMLSFHEKNDIKYSIAEFFFHQSFLLLFCFPVLFSH